MGSKGETETEIGESRHANTDTLTQTTEKEQTLKHSPVRFTTSPQVKILIYNIIK